MRMTEPDTDLDDVSTSEQDNTEKESKNEVAGKYKYYTICRICVFPGNKLNVCRLVRHIRITSP